MQKNSVPKLREVMGRPKKGLLSRNYIWEMCLCSAMDCQIGSD